MPFILAINFMIKILEGLETDIISITKLEDLDCDYHPSQHHVLSASRWPPPTAVGFHIGTKS
jgi:hypothetical protein